MNTRQVCLSVCLLLLVLTPAFSQSRYWIATGSGNWNDAANWSASSGGSGGASVPGTGNTAIFDGAASGACVIDATTTVAGITIAGYTGSLDLNGFTLTSTGTNTFTSGTIDNAGAAATLTLAATGTTTFDGTTFNVSITGSADNILFNGSTFNAAVALTRTGTGTDSGDGGNTFASTLSLTLTGTGQWRLGNTNPDVFAQDVTLDVASTGTISLARTAAGNAFQGNIAVTYTDLGDIILGENGGTATLADTKTISIAGYGTSGCGDLDLENFSQLGTTAQSITLAGNETARLTLTSATFNGAVTTSTPSLILNTCTFNSTVDCTVSSTSTGSNFRGGNVFQSTTTFTNGGDADLHFGATSGDAGDTFYGEATFYSLAGGRIRIGASTADNLFYSDATFYSSGSTDATNRIQVSRFDGASTTFEGTTTFINDGNGSDIHICYGTGTTATFNGPLVLVSSTTASGNFEVGRDGNVIINDDIDITSTCDDAIYFTRGNGSTTMGGGVINISSFAQGTLRFLYFTQTVATAQTITLTGTAILRVGSTSSFMGNVDFRSPRLYLDGASYAGTAYFEKTGDGADYSLSDGNTFAQTTTIVNSGSGTLRQNGSNVFNGETTLQNTGSSSIIMEGDNTYNDNFYAYNSGDASLDLAYVNGSTFNGDVYLENTGAYRIQFGVTGSGTVVNGNLTFLHGGSTSGRNSLLARNAGSDVTIHGDVLFTNTNTDTSSGIFIGYNGDVVIDGNITVTCTAGSGIYFGNNSGSATLQDGYTITATTFTTGILQFANFTQLGSTAQTITTTGDTDFIIGSGATFNGNVSFTAPTLHLSGCTYNGTAQLTKTGTTNDYGAGGNIFNGATTLTNEGSGFLLSCNSYADTFNADVTISNTGSDRIYMAHRVTGTVFNGNIIVNNTGGGTGIYFAANSAGDATLASGYTITVGDGFTSGTLQLPRFVQEGSTAQALTLTGDALLEMGPDTEFNGDVNFVAPQLTIDGVAFQGTAYLEKNGEGNNLSDGGNLFYGTASLVNTGTGYITTGYNSPDIFYDDLTITNTNTSTIRLGDNAVGTTFYGDVILNNTSSGRIYFSNNSGGTCTLTDGSLLEGSDGVTDGYVYLRRFTQTGTAAQSLTFTGTATLMVGPESTFNGEVSFTAPRLYLNGCTFNGVTALEKTGQGNDVSSGGNTFNEETTVTNASFNYIALGNTDPDIFNNTVTFNNTGTSYIYVAHGATGTEFNGDLTMNALSGSYGIRFGYSGGTATLADGYTLNIGGLGFSGSELRLANFTQQGSTSQTLTLSGTASLILGNSTEFNGAVDFRAPQLYIQGTTFESTAYLEKTGATGNASAGNNVFNGVTSLANSGSGALRMNVSGLDIYNNDLTLTNTGSSVIRMADAVAGTAFNGNIVVNSTAGSGIYFGYGGGSSTLASGFDISIGSSGFSAGDLRLHRFTQSGTVDQTLELTGTSRIILGPTSEFNGAVDFRAPQVYLYGATYYNTAYLEKTGATNNVGTGGNIFYLASTIRNSGSGYLLTGQSSPDIFYGDVLLSNTGSNGLYLAYSAAGNEFNGNIELENSGNEIYFGANGGTTTLSTGQTIYVGSGGFASGNLRIKNFTQLGSTTQTITLTGSAVFLLGDAVTFSGDVVFTAPSITLQDVTCNGTAYIEKTGSGTSSSYGNNVFYGTTDLVNSGSGSMRLSTNSSADNAGDIFYSDVTFTESGTGDLVPAISQTSYIYGNITVDAPNGMTLATNNSYIELTGSSAQTINKTTASAEPVFQNLVLTKSAEAVTLNTPIHIGTAMTFSSGIVNTTDDYYLNITNDATVSGANAASYVAGPVRKTGNDAFTFPTGDAGIYRSISMSAPTSSVAAFTAQYYYDAQPYGNEQDETLHNISACEYWTLDRTTGSNNVSVTLTWKSDDCDGTYVDDLSALRVARFDGTTWRDHGNGGTTGDAAEGSVTTAADVTSFSPFALASTTPANPLPIELTYFDASTEGTVVNLSWETSQEVNNDYFTLERSYNGYDFDAIATVAGAGNSSVAISYTHADESPGAGRIYYRLKQTDYDGGYTYSGIVSVYLEEGAASFVLYPNPTRDRVYFDGTFELSVYNSLNQLVLQGNFSGSLNVSSLAAGVYRVMNSQGQMARLVVE